MPRGIYMRKNQVDVTKDDAVVATVEIPTTGDISRDELVAEIEVAGDVVGLSDKAAELAFMEEPVTIHLHESTNPNEEPVIYVGVNGVGVWLQRGREHIVKRKYVLNLATSRPTSYTTVEGVDRDGAKTINLRSHNAVKYPFSVVHDTPKGMEWLRKIQSGAR